MQSNGKFVRTSFSNLIRGRGRGAPRRRNKGLRGMEHHVHAGRGSSGPGDVVLPDEEIRDCGERSTTSMPAEAHPDLGTWCFRTKEQGIAGDGAPRPCRQRPIRTCGRGASGRRNKGLRGVKHHVSAGGGPSELSDVVLPDEGIRDCGE